MEGQLPADHRAELPVLRADDAPVPSRVPRQIRRQVFITRPPCPRGSQKSPKLDLRHPVLSLGTIAGADIQRVIEARTTPSRLPSSMYTDGEIKPYLDDYQKATGVVADKYICPMTLEPCELHEISRGHIINRAIPYPYNVKVPVRTKPDNFYGTRVESAFVRFVTISGMHPIDLLRGRSVFDVKFREDGRTLKAFVVDDDDVEEKQKHLPVIPIRFDGQQLFIGLKDVRLDDPDVPTADEVGRAEISFVEKHLPSHWVASMLKVGHLTLFHIFGYRAVFDPSGDVLRRILVQYFYDNAERDEAPRYFRQFEDAVKIIGMGTTFDPGTYVPADLDTLRDRKFLAHMNVGRLFAMTLLYKLADKTISVTVPQSMNGLDIALATRWYDMLMAEDRELKQTVHLAHFDGESVRVGPALGAHYQPRFETLEVKR